MDARCPVVLDTTGKDVHAEIARLRTQGPTSRVELPRERASVLPSRDHAKFRIVWSLK